MAQIFESFEDFHNAINEASKPHWEYWLKPLEQAFGGAHSRVSNPIVVREDDDYDYEYVCYEVETPSAGRFGKFWLEGMQINGAFINPRVVIFDVDGKPVLQDIRLDAPYNQNEDASKNVKKIISLIEALLKKNKIK